MLRKIFLEGELWYLRKNDIENSVDDIYAKRFIISDKVVRSDDEMSIQVFRYMEHSPGTILDSIINKFNSDLSGVSLVCYVMVDSKVEWQEIWNELLKIKPKVKDISLVGNISPGRFVVGEVYPNLNVSTVNINLFEIKAPKIIEATQVATPSESGITRLGEALLTTKFDIFGFKA